MNPKYKWQLENKHPASKTGPDVYGASFYGIFSVSDPQRNAV